MEEIELKIKPVLIGVDEAIEKAEKLNNLLKEAKTLVDELAWMNFEIDLEEQLQGIEGKKEQFNKNTINKLEKSIVRRRI